MELAKNGSVRICRLNVIPVMLESGKTVRSPSVPSLKSAAAGFEVLICFRTCSSSVVALCVVKRLAAATSSLPTRRGASG